MMTQPTATVYEVLDALGLAQLVKRKGDMGGSMPLRAVRGCAPLFEGNAFGFQITLRHPITLRRSAGGGVVAQMDPPYGEALAIGHRAVLPRLVAQRFLPADGAFEAAFADGFIKVDGAGRISLWTGLCVRADPGVWLRVSATANRRNRLFEVEEHCMVDDGAFAPLILTIELPRNGSDLVRLEGEIGTLAPVAPGMRIEEASLAQVPEVGAAHAAFYNAAYFAAKQDEVTQKYRKLKQPPEAELTAHPQQGGAGACCRVVALGPAAHTITTGAATGVLPCVDFGNLVPFEASYDGHTMAIEPDNGALRCGARAVERTFAEALGPGFLGENPRAMLYFTKYFTPHPPGEPHFFVKPWAFMQTPPGWSCLLEGVHGDGYDVLRGVVATDLFHAVPAVFQVFRVGEPIHVGFAAPLLRVVPIPRRLLAAGFRQATLRA